jgi:hypothetical protein
MSNSWIYAIRSIPGGHEFDAYTVLSNGKVVATQIQVGFQD